VNDKLFNYVTLNTVSHSMQTADAMLATAIWL